ncbi:phosphatase PAP2 family protein [Aquipuribacter hungaricus]|uniref:Phosphatase PAP2 family protein n=1 Tax=Aquipuribacter hungaricus TaxID=545624 RepID=A0ABV7WF60_9MICO
MFTDQTAVPVAAWQRLLGVTLATTLAFGVLMLVTAWAQGLPLRDPDGLLGPSYVRLPLIAAGMMLLDLVPRVGLRVWRTRRPLAAVVRDVARERLSGRRVAVVAAGLASFYISYVAYRNLKSFLPFVNQDLYDRWLVGSDLWFTGGTQPGDLLHDLLGTGVSADLLSATYMVFLPFVPASLAAALVWSDDLSRGAWYASALSLNWIFGTLSYYALPSLGPIYVEPYRFFDLPTTAVTGLQDALWGNRVEVLTDPHATQSVHGIAAFASLHTSIVFTAALIATLCRMPSFVRWGMWVFFVLTALATVYFGWHYVLDVVAGVLLGGAAVWLAALMTGRTGPLSRPRVRAEARTSELLAA